MTNELKIGDHVVLKSGGPVMTVIGLSASGKVWCEWDAVSPDPGDASFLPAMLRPAGSFSAVWRGVLLDVGTIEATGKNAEIIARDCLPAPGRTTTTDGTLGELLEAITRLRDDLARLEFRVRMATKGVAAMVAKELGDGRTARFPDPDVPTAILMVGGHEPQGRGGSTAAACIAHGDSSTPRPSGPTPS